MTEPNKREVELAARWPARLQGQVASLLAAYRQEVRGRIVTDLRSESHGEFMADFCNTVADAIEKGEVG